MASTTKSKAAEVAAARKVKATKKPAVKRPNPEQHGEPTRRRTKP